MLALKYGHSQCARQISHRDRDEHSVIPPRPLSIYDIGPVKSAKNTLHPPASTSFGSLKIAFNESDYNYSSRLAGLCSIDEPNVQRRRRKLPVSSNQTSDSIPTRRTEQVHASHCTEALVNATHSSGTSKDRTTPRRQSSMQPNIDISYQTSVPMFDLAQKPAETAAAAATTRPSLVRRANSAAAPLVKQHFADPSTHAQTRPTHPIESMSSIREARGASSRYNRPENFFGRRPEELFGSGEHVPQMIDHRRAADATRLERPNLRQQIYNWHDDVNQLVDLYSIHHSSNYRTSAVPPLASTLTTIQIGAISAMAPASKLRKVPPTKTPKPPRISTLSAYNILRRTPVTQRTAMKLSQA